MPDMDVIVKSLRRCSDMTICPDDCYYKKYACDCIEKLHRDAINLLKEQEDAYSKLAKEYLSLSHRAAHKPNVVRCKDCRFGYASEFAPPEMRDIWCCARNHILSTVKPDFFCADGERKEGGEV